MSFWKIAWRNMQQRSLASSLTGLSMALGVALMILVIVIHDVAVDQLDTDAQGYHLIVGGKGGELQLVLSTVFHLGRPLTPIPYSYYKKFVDGPFAQYTEAAIPYCLGDSFQAAGQQFRVIGTTPDLFTKIAYGTSADGTPKRYTFAAGHNFQTDHFFEAVLGSVVARKAGLKVGDTFQPTHGISADGDRHDQFTVVGILDSTGTANDRGLFINVEGFYLLEGHALSADTELADQETGQREQEKSAPKETGSAPTGSDRPGQVATHAATSPATERQPLPEGQREVTSILVLCNNEFGPMILDQQINKGSDRIAQAIAPTAVVTRLKETIVGPVRMLLLVLTVLIVVVAGLGILVSIYNSMSERSRDIGVMRALGASRVAVMSIILVESILLALLGGMAGVLLGHTILALAAPSIEAHAGITLHFWQFSWQEALLIPGLVAFASLVGFLPALTAYRTDVARSLRG
jgi:putative ABC transport system permease protein